MKYKWLPDNSDWALLTRVTIYAWSFVLTILGIPAAIVWLFAHGF